MLDELLLTHLIAERKRLEVEVFAAPPKDWAEFNMRLGAWQQLEASRAFLETETQERDI
jgi:hypothetical protein